MSWKHYLKTGFGLFRNFGWKKNLLALAVGFLLCFGLEQLDAILTDVRFLTFLDPAIAVMPFLGFFLGIWGILGGLIEFVLFVAIGLIGVLDRSQFSIVAPYLTITIIALFIYYSLPSMLWYTFPLKGEERATYPTLDTCAHVIKYYVIMVITLIVYVVLNSLSFGISSMSLQDSIVAFTQYLDIVLIVSIPIAIIVSLIRNRTITINERMVLTFLIVGVIASALAGYLIYRVTLRLDPGLFEEYEMMLAAIANGEAVDIAAEDIFTRYYDYWNWFYIVIAVMLNSLLIIEIAFMRSIEKKVTRPIVHLSDVLEKYTFYEEGGLDPDKVKLECKPYRYGYGEVSSLTRTCVEMVGEIDSYTKNLEHVTAEKERISTELDVASNIQHDMLPSVFPPFPDRTEIDLYASMTPAKEVGGDFYDFYFIDQDHLALTIADVSGKGVPASLFMVISKTLLQNHALLGGTPKEILSYVNHQLCQNNDSMMFCTVWLGILDLTNGHIVAANAGHEYPAVLRNGEKFEMKKGRHDPPLGVRDGLRFCEFEYTLAPGDVLFQYTDGVTEGTNAELEEFGTDRLMEALDAHAGQTTKAIVDGVYDALNTYSQGTPQFDDITMLCLKYMGSDGSAKKRRIFASLTIPAAVDRLGEVTKFTEEHLEEIGCPASVIFNMILAVEEIYVNIANYAYGGREEDTKLEISFDESRRMVEVTFTDRGIPFDPTSKKAPDIRLSAEERQIGGLGIYIVRQTMDEVVYDYLGGKNILTIRKRI